MASPMQTVADHLRRAVLPRGTADAELLERFLTARDEAAFEAVVRRHGPMVLAVCRRVLRDRHDAEDAFQVAFLVLARKAGSLRRRELLANWLHGVAYRAALETRAALRRTRERAGGEFPEPEARPEPEDGSELRDLIDRELSRLPERFRAAVVLCELEGKSRHEAARQLGVPEGTLSSRLATARRTLARRLARHGALPAALLTTAGATAGVPPALVTATVRAAATAGDVPARVAALTQGILTTMMLKKLKQLAMTLMTLGLIGAGGLLSSFVGGEPARAAAADKKDKAELGPRVQGTVRAADAGKKTITVVTAAEKTGKKTEERTYPLADDVEVVLEDVIGKEKDRPSPKGAVADLTPGTGVQLQLSADGKKVVGVSARGPSLNGRVQAVDAKTNTITVSAKEADGKVNRTFEVAKGAKVTVDDGIGKKNDPPRELKLADLAEGSAVIISQSVNRKVALAIRLHGSSLDGQLKGYDAGNRIVTVTVKEDAQVVDKSLTLAKEANVEGDLTSGARVSVRLSALDKEIAVAVRVRKDD